MPKSLKISVCPPPPKKKGDFVHFAVGKGNAEFEGTPQIFGDSNLWQPAVLQSKNLGWFICPASNASIDL